MSVERSCGELLRIVALASERAAVLAREFRADPTLVQLLVQRKEDKSVNGAVFQDVKTLADVLIQELVRKSIADHFPEMEEYVVGEESAVFQMRTGKEHILRVCDTREATQALLEAILGDGLDPGSEQLALAQKLALVLAEVAHEPIEMHMDFPEITSTFDPMQTGVWIDPIDCTSAFVKGRCAIPTPYAPILTSDALPAVTVLIGAFDRRTGQPLLGVVNQPFHAYSSPGHPRSQSPDRAGSPLTRSSATTPLPTAHSPLARAAAFAPPPAAATLTRAPVISVDSAADFPVTVTSSDLTSPPAATLDTLSSLLDALNQSVAGPPLHSVPSLSAPSTPPPDAKGSFRPGFSRNATCDFESSSPLLMASRKTSSQPTRQSSLASEAEVQWTGRLVWGIASAVDPQWGQSSPPVRMAPDLHEEDRPFLVHSNKERADILERLGAGYTLCGAPGAGYKMLCVIDGLAMGLLTSSASTYMWDTCGPHAILLAQGARVGQFGADGSIEYHKGDHSRSGEKIWANQHGLVIARTPELFAALQSVALQFRGVAPK